MYNLALSFNEESFYNVAKSSFLDMQAAGITTLGEFHYLHHENPLDSPDSKPFNFDKIILKAANDTNMRIVLLLTYYEQGGVGVNKKELESAQKRFETPNFEDFWKNFDNLQMDIINEGRKMQSLGVCAHSIRGVGLENIGLLRQEAEKRGVPFHMHLEEQPQEIQDCLEVFGKTPSQLLLNDLKDNIADNMTLIHCTHTKNEDLKLWVKKKANICVCPLTEGNLGDGVFPFLEEEDGEMNVSLGSDCNFRLCFFEEMRWLLYCQQMRNGKRGLSKNLVNSEKVSDFYWFF